MTDRDFLRKVNRRWPYAGTPASLAAIDYHVSEALEENLPVFASVIDAKRELATYWLREAAPRGFFRRVCWAFRILREVLR